VRLGDKCRRIAIGELVIPGVDVGAMASFVTVMVHPRSGLVMPFTHIALADLYGV
jgi:hypothetical protein